MPKDLAPATEGELLIYPAGDGSAGIRVLLAGDTVWLTQARIAELYQTTPQNITQHLKAIYAEGELEEAATCKDYLQVRQEGGRKVSRRPKHYRLEAILAVGYRVRSTRGTEFRQWATARLAEYLVKGFVLDDERLKGNLGPASHFDELLARIREIRASEARAYQRIREIFAMAVDYREGEQDSQHFFAIMQNKMHYAATGLTAAEIVHRRADAARPNMGLTAWKGSRVLKQDVGAAKNYLDAQEIDTLNRITVMFLDQAEFRAMRRQDIRLTDWHAFLDKFLRDTELPVLDNAGKTRHADALQWAERQYDAFAEQRRLRAEQAADARYLQDLRATAETMRAATARKTATTRKARRMPKSGGTGDEP
ncbi:virulence RhuM family protein [Pseudoxanthomonas mexicana]|uniref:virulence RhuM family protein n=1 Tax=Pseudoxanthomonas mexicana TaxID=128785 RepID=UPI00398BB356